jgi:cation:H+ antiporter
MSVFFFLVLGLVLLVVAAELLVRGSSRLGLRFGLSPLVVGLTIVAFGTSSPELAVGISAGLLGQSHIAVGNIVGSNIFNVLVVLGVSALITPLVVQQQLVRFDVPLAIGVSLIFLLMALDGNIGLLDGLLLTAGIVSYTVFAIRQSRQESAAINDEYSQEFASAGGLLDRLSMQLLAIVAGLLLLVLGAHWLVESAVAIARALGVSEVVIALTIIAAGTSLPELATSIVAALRGERDIAVGNVIGSGLFNLLAIGGIAALVTPGGLSVAPSVLSFDLPMMVAVALACLPIFATGHQISRWEGALFFAYYIAYVTYLILAATTHAALPIFSGIMLAFVLPLTVVTLIVLLLRHRKQPTDSMP